MPKTETPDADRVRLDKMPAELRDLMQTPHDVRFAQVLAARRTKSRSLMTNARTDFARS